MRRGCAGCAAPSTAWPPTRVTRGLRTHPYRALPGHGGCRVSTLYVDQGAGAWRLFWTWGPADNDRDQDHAGRDGTVLTVLLIHL
ncbi:hypothetical protein PUR61_05240 [Streptomyces sp. BE20]|uniref:hypothetical protein n=1 Tax=Streptomyces sp. BE20 TaxID=3002525 RepID=UPI002E799A00|nr:hypothetical protein [Streptomyces sp. BE20]MEE1821602.1 hypothetical protein [Streptomyces sp. BE20]